ncbi:hypothetical protein GCWU000321_00377 [Dialister invisus DSM 15470]|uniref:Uncharacterized protein n=1 Tax=Dialister invisus DSM 15470 TaxID=592028 RepID=C9LRA2_9FIRM|nr:hypothetical protein GCWU000321_00377 [Dialister invisus DSM 15470]
MVIKSKSSISLTENFNNDVLTKYTHKKELTQETEKTWQGYIL